MLSPLRSATGTLSGTIATPASADTTDPDKPQLQVATNSSTRTGPGTPVPRIDRRGQNGLLPTATETVILAAEEECPEVRLRHSRG